MIEQQRKLLDRGIRAEFVGEAQLDIAVVKRVIFSSCTLVLRTY